jgi:hypothetical protein
MPYPYGPQIFVDEEKNQIIITYIDKPQISVSGEDSGILIK